MRAGYTAWGKGCTAVMSFSAGQAATLIFGFFSVWGLKGFWEFYSGTRPKRIGTGRDLRGLFTFQLFRVEGFGGSFCDTSEAYRSIFCITVLFLLLLLYSTTVLCHVKGSRSLFLPKAETAMEDLERLRHIREQRPPSTTLTIPLQSKIQSKSQLPSPDSHVYAHSTTSAGLALATQIHVSLPSVPRFVVLQGEQLSIEPLFHTGYLNHRQ